MSKQSSEKIPNTDESWESGLLGADPEYVRVVQKELAGEVDDTLELQMISIRLSKELIKAYRLLGARDGMGYQPLMREVLKRFVDSEFKMIAQETLEKQIRNLAKETDKENKKVA